jgi:hypothetical protein
MAPDMVMKGPIGVNWRDFFDVIEVILGINLKFGQLCSTMAVNRPPSNNQNINHTLMITQ